MATNMKLTARYLAAFIALICATALGACSKSSDNDDEKKVTETNIAGEWICSDLYIDGDVDINHETFEYGDFRLTLLENGHGSLKAFGETQSIKWTAEDKKIVFDKPLLGSEEWTIVSLKKDSMILRFSEEMITLTLEFTKYVEPDYDGKLSAENLVGRWALLMGYDYDDDRQKQYTYTPEELASGNVSFYMDLKPDGTGQKTVRDTFSTYYSPISLKWEYRNNNLYITHPGESEPTVWKIEEYDGTKLKVTFGKSEGIFIRTGKRF